MATDSELDAAVRRVLGEILTEGAPYTGLPLVNPSTSLLPDAVVDAIRSPLEDGITDLDEAVGNIQPAVASLETLVSEGRLSEPQLLDMAETPEDQLLLPPADKCARGGCARTSAEHTGWQNGGPFHEFEPPPRAPRPEFVASSFISTTWNCAHCGADCYVWGTADMEWMECAECGRESFVMFT